MALFSRISRLFKADMHAVIDRLEEPYLILQQSIREMEAALAEDEQVLRVARQRYQEVIDRLEQVISNITKLDGELDVCFDAGNDSLARAVVKGKLEQQQLEQVLTVKQKQLSEKVMVCQSRVEQRRPQLEGMRQKAEIFAEELQSKVNDSFGNLEISSTISY